MHLSFVMHLSEDGRMSGRNMQQLYGAHNILSHTYVHLFVLISYLITLDFTYPENIVNFHDKWNPKLDPKYELH